MDIYQFDAAHEILESLIQDEPENRKYLIIKGHYLMQTNRTDEAVAFFENLSARFPEDPIIKAEWAVALTTVSRIEEAVKMIESVDSPEMSKDCRFLHCKGRVLVASEKDYTEKFRDFLIQSILTAYPQEPSEDVRYLLTFGMQTTYQMGMFDVAMLILDKIPWIILTGLMDI